MDAETLEPVVFATIRIKGKSLGVISNMDGSFKIPSFFKKEGDTLEISSMGYALTPIALLDVSDNITNIITVKPNVMKLDEVVVKAKKRTRAIQNLSAVKIVQLAIESLPKNLPQNPYSYVGYYRDYQLKDSNYVNLNEAILKIFDKGSQAKDFETTNVRIFDYRQNTDFQRDSLGALPYDYENKRKMISGAFLNNYGGNEFVILRVHDPIRNRNVNTFDFVNVLENDFITHHVFEKEEDVLFENDNFYHVSFKNKQPFKGLGVQGDMYISKNSFAIRNFEYAIYYSKKKKSKKKKGIDEVLFETKLEYTQKDGFMYLNYHSMDNSFKVVLPPKFIVEKAVFNPVKKCFVIRFNNDLKEKEALKKSNYKVLFKGKKLKFKKLVLIGDEVLLFPDMEKEQNVLLYNEIEAVMKESSICDNSLKIYVKNLKDVDGNEIYKKTYSTRRQFRQFFVQQLETNAMAIPSDTSLMKKNAPIFKNQPIIKPDNFDDYWMNTPLRKTEN
ncbi:carboxypeptidase-like regulatory domain-containing protein [Maribacter sp. 2210JD10-5]|uniref:carboxypeptidase-like regulatory domain-containing protein n=1 Tax=Maribacter sp. 2210JD10-5 TaxID=3386272 RepID=UPI0039BD6B6D